VIVSIRPPSTQRRTVSVLTREGRQLPCFRKPLSCNFTQMRFHTAIADAFTSIMMHS